MGRCLASCRLKPTWIVVGLGYNLWSRVLLMKISGMGKCGVLHFRGNNFFVQRVVLSRYLSICWAYCFSSCLKPAFHDTDIYTDTDSPDTPVHPYVRRAISWSTPVASWTTRRHSRDNLREDVGEDVGVRVRVRVRVGVVECQLYRTKLGLQRHKVTWYAVWYIHGNLNDRPRHHQYSIWCRHNDRNGK